MAKAIPRNRVSDFRGVGRLAVDATVGLASLAEALHHNISRAPAPWGPAVEAPMGGLTGLVYSSIRGATRAVGGGVDLLLREIAPLLAHEPSTTRRDAVLAALNGVLGDHLAWSGNPLAIRMCLRREGAALELTGPALREAIAQPRPRVLVLVHGLCFSDLQWRRNGHDHGAALARDALPTRPLTELYLYYNSGLHVSANGRSLAETLEALCQAWPVPLEELIVVAHSMGGLVAHSACVHGARMGHQWLGRLRRVAFLGTPHEGAPLERGGHWVDIVLGASPYTAAFARLGKLRSAGITDLRHGSVVEDARKPVPLPAHVACYAIAGSLARRAGGLKERMLGDGLVPVESALGLHAGPGSGPLFSPSHRAIAYGVGHLALIDSKRVYRRLQRWLA